jgi:hypothetical protein
MLLQNCWFNVIIIQPIPAHISATYFCKIHFNVILPSTSINWEPVSLFHVPALRRPSSAACPPGRMLFTKMLSAPRGESRPPTIVKPRPFFPLPFSNMIVWKEQTDDRGRRGNVQKLVVDVRLMSSLLPISVTEGQCDKPCTVVFTSGLDPLWHNFLSSQLLNKHLYEDVSKSFRTGRLGARTANGTALCH